MSPRWMTAKFWKSSPHLLGLFLVMAVYVGFAGYLCYTRLVGFYYENWDFDIFPQAFWSTTHGRILWEVGDYELFGVSSFFQVHPSLLMFPLAGLYALAPNPFTLIYLQVTVTVLAAVPLYLLTRHLTRSDGKALLAAGLYLVWIPVLSSNLYDFHLESFFPLDLLTFSYLWLTQRYRLASVAAVVTFATLEIGPILIFFFLVFFEYDPLKNGLLRLWQRVRGASPPSGSPGRRWNDLSRSFRWGIGLGVASLVAYLILRLLEGPLVPYVIGFHPAFQPFWGFSAGSVGLSPVYLGTFFTTKVAYWFELVALLAFVPFLYPRALIPSLPWFLSTMFSPYPNYVTIGYQYGYLAAPPLMLAFAYGLTRVDFSGLRAWFKGTMRGHFEIRSLSTAVGVVLVVAIAANVVLSPADPLAQYSHIPESGPPGYWTTYQPGEGYDQVQQLADLVPTGSTILASDNLFFTVDNNVNAYTTLWYPADPPNLPFNDSNLPQYAFFSWAEIPEIPSFMIPVLYNTSIYGERGTVGHTPVGPVALFEKGYHGPVESLLPLSPQTTVYYGDKLSIGDANVVENSSAQFNVSIDSAPPTPGLTGPSPVLWYGPYVNLPTGTYSITLSLRAESLGNASPSTPVLWIDSSGFATPLCLSSEINLGSVDGAGWSQVTYVVSLPAQYWELEVRGYLLDPAVAVQLNYLEITPS